ncbi:MAG: ISKra4 family transposase, partial [Ilumatobacter sp.]
MRTLYGSHRLASPRWWTCPCSGPRHTFSPLAELLPQRVTPELSLVEAKLAAHMSYGAAAGLLAEVFPIGRQMHRSELFRTVSNLADRLNAELTDDQFSYSDPNDLDDTTPPQMPIVVCVDGGYVHSSEQTSRRDGWFQAVCGTVTTHNGTTRRFGFVPNIDPTPRSRIRGVLEAQGLRQDQLVTFLTDGADDLASFCEHMNHTAEYVLDWFHIAMRFTVLSNTATNVAWTTDDDDNDGDDADICDRLVEEMRADIGRAKWFLWHGNHYRALQVLDDATETLHYCDDTTARTKSLKMIVELFGYLERNQHRIPSYAERHRAGEPISSAPAEGAVNHGNRETHGQ